MGDAVGTGRRSHLRPSVYIFATYKGVSVLGIDGHRRQTQTDAITPQLPSLLNTYYYRVSHIEMALTDKDNQGRFGLKMVLDC